MLFEKQILNMYKGMMHTRCDQEGKAFYFSHNDFEGLRCEEYCFRASAGHKLQGYLYSYDNPIESRLIVFDHGFGGGHRSYMKEIQKLCEHGFLVFAYDHTGCMCSEGDSSNGLAQSLCDLNDCISYIKSEARFEGLKISVMGHSWGGFSTLNICALHPDITHIVAMAGFVSVEQLVKSYFGGIMKGYRKLIIQLEQETNPYFSKFDAVTTLKDSDVKALLIYSDNDGMCRKVHYDLLRSALADKPNVSFILEHNKGHNPNYTEDASKYLLEYVKEKSKLDSDKKLVTPDQKAFFLTRFDWNRMTAQDERVWQKIFEHLDDTK